MAWAPYQLSPSRGPAQESESIATTRASTTALPMLFLESALPITIVDLWAHIPFVQESLPLL